MMHVNRCLSDCVRIIHRCCFFPLRQQMTKEERYKPMISYNYETNKKHRDLAH